MDVNRFFAFMFYNNGTSKQKESDELTYTLKTNELFHIQNPRTGYASYGGNQAWYPNFWHKQAGCGPTTAANQMAYLGFTRDDYKALYPFSSYHRQDYTKHMQNLFKYVTPGMMGVNHINKLRDGVLKYAIHNGIELEAHTLSVEKNDMGNRDVEHLKKYISKGLSNDSPIAFLNLSSGKEHRLYPWHWITITSASIDGDKIIATASDEGHRKTFDLSLWYHTTPMHGGFVYFL